MGFDLDERRFSFGLSISEGTDGLACAPFSPTGDKGPRPSNQLHINSVFCTRQGLYFSGLKTGGLYRFDGRSIVEAVTLPPGTHNARPHRDGVLFNDTRTDAVRFVSRDGQERVFNVPKYDPDRLTHTDFDDSRIARQAFGRGLCVLSDNLIAAGSSPSTITLHDLDSMQTTLSVNLSMDVRSAIHGLEVWPYARLPDG